MVNDSDYTVEGLGPTLSDGGARHRSLYLVQSPLITIITLRVLIYWSERALMFAFTHISDCTRISISGWCRDWHACVVQCSGGKLLKRLARQPLTRACLTPAARCHWRVSRGIVQFIIRQQNSLQAHSPLRSQLTLRHTAFFIIIIIPGHICGLYHGAVVETGPKGHYFCRNKSERGKSKGWSQQSVTDVTYL